MTLRQDLFYVTQKEHRESHVKNSNIQPDRKHFCRGKKSDTTEKMSYSLITQKIIEQKKSNSKTITTFDGLYVYLYHFIYTIHDKKDYPGIPYCHYESTGSC